MAAFSNINNLQTCRVNNHTDASRDGTSHTNGYNVDTLRMGTLGTQLEAYMHRSLISCHVHHVCSCPGVLHVPESLPIVGCCMSSKDCVKQDLRQRPSMARCHTPVPWNGDEGAEKAAVISALAVSGWTHFPFSTPSEGCVNSPQSLSKPPLSP